MANQCENCGKPVLKSDTVCWHCGAGLTPSDEPRSVSAPSPEELPDEASGSRVALYAGLTAVMLVALIGVLLLLSRQPLVALTPETSGTGWQVVDTPAQTFSLNLPDSWEVIRTPEDLGRDLLEIALEDDPELGRAAGPLATLAPDAELRLVARNVGQQPATLVVVQSDNLSRLSPSEIVTSIRSGDLGEFEVLSSATAEGIDGYTQAQFALRYPENVRCEQRVVPRADTAFIVSACAPFDQYPLYSVGFETLLDSFQTLQR